MHDLRDRNDTHIGAAASTGFRKETTKRQPAAPLMV